MRDVTDAASVERAAEGCDAVLHMAALVKVWVPDATAFDRVNVGGLRHALAAAKKAGARLVYTSSFIAVGPAGPEPADESRAHDQRDFRNHYERTKTLADQVAREAAAAGQDIVLLYPGVVYGPGERTEGSIGRTRAKAEAELGYRRTPLTQGLEATLAWMRAESLVPAFPAS